MPRDVFVFIFVAAGRFVRVSDVVRAVPGASTCLNPTNVNRQSRFTVLWTRYCEYVSLSPVKIYVQS